MEVYRSTKQLRSAILHGIDVRDDFAPTPSPATNQLFNSNKTLVTLTIKDIAKLLKAGYRDGVIDLVEFELHELFKSRWRCVKSFK